jgi:hypothetical protein
MMNHDLVKTEEIWQKLVEATDCNYVMFCSSGNEKDKYQEHIGQLFTIYEATQVHTP